MWLKNTHGIFFQQGTMPASDGSMIELYKVVHNGETVIITGQSQREIMDPYQIMQYDRRLGI
jgi:hypothetical protein